MSDNIIASLKAIISLDTSKFDAGVKGATAATRQLGETFRDAGGRLHDAQGRFTKATSSLEDLADGADKAKSTFGGLSGVMAVFGGTVLAKLSEGLVSAGAQSLRMAGDFEQSMNTLSYVTKATGADFDALRDKARALGGDIRLPGTSSLDAAQAMLELSKAGLSVGDTIGAARASLQLAAAAQIDAGSAAKICANALNQFHLQGDQAVRVADLLAASANSSSGEITDMAAALNQSGSAFAALHIPIEDASTAIALLAKNGILGSDAGTSLKTMLTQLSSPTEKAKQVMDYLNLSLFDSNGKFVGLREAANRYQTATKNLSDEQKLQVASTLAGTDGMRGLLNVLGEGGKAFDDAKKKVSELGAAQGAADAQTKGFNGALDGLKSAWDSWAEAAGAYWLPNLTALVNGLANGIPVFDRWMERFADWNAAGVLQQQDANTAIQQAGTSALSVFAAQQEADLKKRDGLRAQQRNSIADSKTFVGALKGIFTVGGYGEDFSKQISALEATIAKRQKAHDDA